MTKLMQSDRIVCYFAIALFIAVLATVSALTFMGRLSLTPAPSF